MKKALLTFLIIFISYSLKAQDNKSITIGKKETIVSKILNENRNLLIYTPNITSTNPNPNKKYPVLYLLDGEAHFYSTVGIIQQLSQANGNGVLPEIIVVGIENTNRHKDLVPSDNAVKPNPFVDFLSNELIPYIDRNYNTAPYKILVGHSLGGLMVVDVLTNFPNLFNAYIAIDPSMWYNNEKYLLNTRLNLQQHNVNTKRLFIGIANTLPNGLKFSQVKNDKSAETQHMRSILKLDKYLKNNIKNLEYKSNYYDTETHTSVPLISEYDGLKFVFDYYHLNLTEKEFADSTNQIALKIASHYKNVSQKMGYQNAAPESLINYLAYEALNKKYFSKAKALFELNIDFYPNSSNAYDAYADYYTSIKDTSNAIICYQKSLKIKENIETRSKLNRLSNKIENTTENYDLQEYTGVYILEVYNIPIVLELRDAKLFAKVSGQEDDELLPISKDKFTVKGKQGYTITFIMNGKKPKEFTSVQPNGTFKAIYKNE